MTTDDDEICPICGAVIVPGCDCDVCGGEEEAIRQADKAQSTIMGEAKK